MRIRPRGRYTVPQIAELTGLRESTMRLYLRTGRIERDGFDPATGERTAYGSAVIDYLARRRPRGRPKGAR